MEDPNAPATKGDLINLKDVLTGNMQQLEDRLTETMRDVQTEMLKAFYSYAQGNDLRLKQAETIDNQLRERMSIFESRLTEIERRLNLPPAA